MLQSYATCAVLHAPAAASNVSTDGFRLSSAFSKKCDTFKNDGIYIDMYYQVYPSFMSGAPAIDTRSQNNYVKRNKAKGKAKNMQNNVAVRVCRFFHCFALFSHLFRFCPRSVQQVLLTGKSSHKCRSGTREKKHTNAKTKQIALLLHFHLLLFCLFFHVFSQTHYLMVGHAWLPLPNIILL